MNAGSPRGRSDAGGSRRRSRTPCPAPPRRLRATPRAGSSSPPAAPVRDGAARRRPPGRAWRAAQAVERPLGPGRERRAELRLERVVLHEQRRSGFGVSLLIQRCSPCQIPRFSVHTRSQARARAGGRPTRSWAASSSPACRPSRRRRREPPPDDGHRRDRDGTHEERDTTLRGHRGTMAAYLESGGRGWYDPRTADGLRFPLGQTHGCTARLANAIVRK